MPLSRRNLIKLSAASATALAIGGRGTPVAAAIPSGAAGAVAESATAFFGNLGFTRQPPLDLLTGEAFNGGLRYDETDSGDPKGKSVRIQPSARIDDISERNRPGVLAAFNIIGVEDADADDGTVLPAVLKFLIDERGLDPAKMLFVSTEDFRPYIEHLDDVGAELIVERALEEARMAGDGSGYFEPDGHPHAPSHPTVGLYYPVPGSEPDGDPVYPPAGYIEIGEVGLAPSMGAGLGVERIAMAEGAPGPDFEETRLNLLRTIEDEAERTGKPLPDGYRLFASL